MTAILSDPDASPARGELSLALVVTSLMRGVVYRETQPDVWRHLRALQPDLRDHVATLGLVPVVDETEGYAFLRQRPEEDHDPAAGGIPIPRLVARRSLSMPVSLLLALLRRRLAEFDAGHAGSRLVLTREDVVALLTDFVPDSGRSRLVDQVDGHIAKVVDLGFLRRMPPPGGGFEVRRVIKAFVDAQWLTELDARLAEYAAGLTPGGIRTAGEDTL